MSMQRKDPTEAIAAVRGDAITITTEQCIKAWREAVPGAIDDPTHIDVVGAMGSASSIGLGIALAQPARKVIVMDGDGSLLMQLGSLVTIAGAAPENFYHVVFENGVYATSGGQPLPAEGRLDFEMLARGAGFAHAARFDDASEFNAALPGLRDAPDRTRGGRAVGDAERDDGRADEGGPQASRRRRGAMIIDCHGH